MGIMIKIFQEFGEFDHDFVFNSNNSVWIGMYNAYAKKKPNKITLYTLLSKHKKRKRTL
jgi:hypothetical protein